MPKKKPTKKITKKRHLKPPVSDGGILLSLYRGILLGLRNFWRNKFLSFATIIVMAVIIFIFNVILAIQYTGHQALNAFNERVDIVLNLRNDVEYYDAQGIVEDLKQIDGVKEVTFTSKEQALEIVAQTHPQSRQFLETYGLANPLPPSISIITNSPADHPKIRAYINSSENNRYFESFETQGASGESMVLSSVAKNLENINTFIQQIVFWIVFVFILGGTLIIVNAIQLTIFNRKKEIHIMRLVGATPGFIRLPYIFEAILYGGFAVLLSFLILAGLTYSVELNNLNLINYYQELQVQKIFTAELIVTLILTIVSSLSATEQYIKGKLIVH